MKRKRSRRTHGGQPTKHRRRRGEPQHWPGTVGQFLKWWAQQDLNLRPSDYESPALTTELWAQVTVSKVLAPDRSVKPPAVGFSPGFPPHEKRARLTRHQQHITFDKLARRFACERHSVRVSTPGKGIRNKEFLPKGLPEAHLSFPRTRLAPVCQRASSINDRRR